MEPFSDYDRYDAVGLSALVSSGEVHPGELVAAAAHRVADVNPAINAVIWERLDEAAHEAAADDRSGPFAGVPILIKDLVVERGKPATFGSVFFRDYVGETTSEFRRRISAAGFVDIGRTNTPEFGLLPTTEPVLYGPTRNPWDLTRSAGGSSGGAAAAVAAGIVPLAQGSDGGGSIRIPASATGLFGLKPSRGRNPRRPGTSIDSLSVEHVLTRTVRDSATFLDAVHGSLAGDRYWAPPPRGTFADAAATDPGRLRIAFSTRDFRGDGVHGECAAAVAATAGLLEELGHEVVEAEPDVDGDMLATAFMETWAALAATGLGQVLDAASSLKPAVARIRRLAGDRAAIRMIDRFDQRESGRPAFEPFTLALADRSSRRSQVDLLAADTALQAISHQIGDFFGRFDVFLTPVLGEPPVPLGRIDQNLPWEAFVEIIFRYVAFTPVANVGGYPAMSVPLHWTASGLPVGSHFLGRFGDEETLLSLAGQLERARPWKERIPPVHA